jgi:hypothetical protein
MTVEIGILIGIAGCFVGLAGWLSGRDKKISGDAQWRGEVNAKLDGILGIRCDVDGMDERMREHDKEIAGLKKDTASAHKRIDGLEAKVK